MTREATTLVVRRWHSTSISLGLAAAALVFCLTVPLACKDAKPSPTGKPGADDATAAQGSPDAKPIDPAVTYPQPVAMPEGYLPAVRDVCERFYAGPVTFVRKDGAWRIGSIASAREPIQNTPGDADLERISTLGIVESLKLQGMPRFTTEGMRNLAKVKGLRELAIYYHEPTGPMKLAEDDLKTLASMKELESLDLFPCQLFGDLSLLKDLPKLKRLWMYVQNSDTAPEGSLHSISQLQSLEELRWLGGKDYLPDIVKLKNLRRLIIPSLDADGVTALKAMPQLEHLEAWLIPQADSVMDLSVMAKLKSLKITGIKDAKDGKVRLPQGLQELEMDTWSMDQLDMTELPVKLQRLVVMPPYSMSDWPSLPKLINGFPELRELILKCADTTLLADIPALPRLRAFGVKRGMGQGVTRAADAEPSGLGAINAMSSLESLVLDTGCDATWSDVEPMLRNLPKLQELNLHDLILGNRILRGRETSAWVAALAGMKQLRSLTISEPDAGLVAKSLKRLESLETLSISGVDTDELLLVVAGMKNLRTLKVSGSKITDDGLTKLAGLKELRTLDLSFASSCTDKGIAAMVKTMPNLQEITLTYRGKMR